MLITSEYVSAGRRKDKNNNYNEYANHDKDYQKKLPLGGMGGQTPNNSSDDNRNDRRSCPVSPTLSRRKPFA